MKEHIRAGILNERPSILAVNFSETMICALRSTAGTPDITSTGFHQAFDLLDEHQFSSVLFDLANSLQPYQDVLELLSITPVTTQLISVSPRRISHQEYKFSKLGVRNLISPVSAEQLWNYCR